MGVGSSRAERIHTHGPRAVGAFQLRGPGRHLKIKVFPIDSGIRLVKVQIRWGNAVVRCQNAFDEARNAGGTFQMPHVRLDRSDQAALSRRAVSAQHGAE